MRKGIRMTGLRELVRTRGGWSGRGAGQQDAWQDVRVHRVCPVEREPAGRAGALGDKVEEVSRA